MNTCTWIYWLGDGEPEAAAGLRMQEADGWLLVTVCHKLSVIIIISVATVWCQDAAGG